MLWGCGYRKRVSPEPTEDMLGNRGGTAQPEERGDHSIVCGPFVAGRRAIETLFRFLIAGLSVYWDWSLHSKCDYGGHWQPLKCRCRKFCLLVASKHSRRSLEILGLGIFISIVAYR